MVIRSASRTFEMHAPPDDNPRCEVCRGPAACDIESPVNPGLSMSLAVVWGTGSAARASQPTRLCFECLAQMLEDESAGARSAEPRSAVR